MSGQSGGRHGDLRQVPANTLTGGNTYNFELEVVDSANVPEGTFSAASNTITVKPALTVATPTASAPNLDLDQAETVTGNSVNRGIALHLQLAGVDRGRLQRHGVLLGQQRNRTDAGQHGHLQHPAQHPDYPRWLHLQTEDNRQRLNAKHINLLRSQTVSVSSRLTSATTPTISLNVIVRTRT